MAHIKKHPLVIFTNGLGTRMAISKPKTLIRLASRETILSRLLKESQVSGAVSELIVFVRSDSKELQKTLQQTNIPMSIVTQEPQGYFHDLIAAKRDLDLAEFSIVDSDLVVPQGELARFLSQTPKQEAWLTIGITKFPEQPSGRPTWVNINDYGYISKTDRKEPMAFRTIGVFHWSKTAFEDVLDKHIPPQASVMAYIAERLKFGVHSLQFSRTVNINTKEDIRAANELIGMSA